MPKVGMKPIRKQQLIEATLASIDEFGLYHTTITTISKKAGLSSGIINHYFGGKQQLIEATVRHLLDKLNHVLVEKTAGQTLSPVERLNLIVESNFSVFQRSEPATKAWLSFWEQSLHVPELARLQHINNQRLLSNLRFSFQQLMPKDQAIEAAQATAAMIDGFWLRSALSQESNPDFVASERLCKQFIAKLIS